MYNALILFLLPDKGKLEAPVFYCNPRLLQSAMEKGAVVRGTLHNKVGMSPKPLGWNR
jgi:hypothetical protein